jgi:hypothetical protein
LLDTPSNGSYSLKGGEVANLSFPERARIRNREIGFIFQSFNLIGDLTVYENVELPLTYRGMAASERKAFVNEALERVGMAHRAKHLPSQLSGGQQQRVAVARALAGKPPSFWLTNRTATSIRAMGGGYHGSLKRIARRRRDHLHGHATRVLPSTPTAPSTCSTAGSSRTNRRMTRSEKMQPGDRNGGSIKALVFRAPCGQYHRRTFASRNSDIRSRPGLENPRFSGECTRRHSLTSRSALNLRPSKCFRIYVTLLRLVAKIRSSPRSASSSWRSESAPRPRSSPVNALSSRFSDDPSRGSPLRAFQDQHLDAIPVSPPSFFE